MNKNSSMVRSVGLRKKNRGALRGQCDSYPRKHPLVGVISRPSRRFRADSIATHPTTVIVYLPTQDVKIGPDGESID